MKRAIFSLAAAVSAVVLIATVIVGVRSFFVGDFLAYSNWTQEPLTPEARAKGAAMGQSLNLIARGSAWTLMVSRGLVMADRQLTLDPMSRWDEAFEQKYVNHPRWDWQRVEPPLHGKFASGVGGWLGFGWSDVPPPRSAAGRWVTVQVPLWAVAAVAAVLPGVWVRRARRLESRKRRGLCLACGYDLRGSAGRCPECGREGAGEKNQEPPAAQAR